MCFVIIALVVIGLGVGIYFLVSSGALSSKSSSSSSASSSFLGVGGIEADTTNISFVEIVEKVADCGLDAGPSARRLFMEV